MPFGWGGFDAAGKPRASRAIHEDKSPMPFGWGGFDANDENLDIAFSRLWSPMPFGWGGFDANHHGIQALFRQNGLQCLSAGAALMPL